MRKRVKAAIGESKIPRRAKKSSGSPPERRRQRHLRVRPEDRRDGAALPLNADRSGAEALDGATEVVGSRGRHPAACGSLRSVQRTGIGQHRGLTTVRSARPWLSDQQQPRSLQSDVVDHGPGHDSAMPPLDDRDRLRIQDQVVRSRTVSTSATTASTTREDHETIAGNRDGPRQIEGARQHDHGRSDHGRPSADRQGAHRRRGRQRKPRFLRARRPNRSPLHLTTLALQHRTRRGRSH